VKLQRETNWKKISLSDLTSYMEQLNWCIRLKGLRHGDRVYVAHQLSKVDVWIAVAVESSPSWLRDMAAKLEAGFRASSATELVACPLPFYLANLEFLGYRSNVSAGAIAEIIFEWDAFDYVIAGFKDAMSQPAALAIVSFDDFAIFAGTTEFALPIVGDLSSARQEFEAFALGEDRSDLKRVAGAMRAYGKLEEGCTVTF